MFKHYKNLTKTNQAIRDPWIFFFLNALFFSNFIFTGIGDTVYMKYEINSYEYDKNSTP